MPTMRDIVEGAALRLRLIRAGESLDAADAADMLQALNDLLASLEGRGLNIGFAGDLSLSNAFPLGDRHVAGLKAILAERVAEDLGKPVSQVLNRDAREGWNTLHADYRLPDGLRVEHALGNLPSQRRVRR